MQRMANPAMKSTLEDALGAADSETILQFDSFFRLAYYHRLELTYIELHRNSSKALERDFVFR